MAKRKLNKCILIVCEGTKTEHNYLKYIAQTISYPQKIWAKVEISDNNTIPNDIPLPEPTSLGKRKKRKFENTNKHKNEDRNVLKELFIARYGIGEGVEKYEEIRAVPLRHVAQAQEIEREQELYDELWAVYDKDGHTRHQEAFDRSKVAVNGKLVNIGFTSRSFEHWLLLHFEKNETAFTKSECKEGERSLECDSEKGCQGRVCLAGYIRTHTPLIGYKKSNSGDEFKKMMDILLNPANLQIAFENAQSLRNDIKVNPNLANKPYFELNPYTNIDILIKKLIE